MYYVYVLTNKPRGTLYVGVTNNLVRRVWEHRGRFVSGFTRKYHLSKLVHYEGFEELVEAIQREVRVKRWRRRWKIQLIERENPDWVDLYPGIADGAVDVSSCY
jgi:putative endonuclease